MIYFIDPIKGNNSNDGSSVDKAFLDIEVAMKKVVDGDELILSQGFYTTFTTSTWTTSAKNIKITGDPSGIYFKRKGYVVIENDLTGFLLINSEIRNIMVLTTKALAINAVGTKFINCFFRTDLSFCSNSEFYFCSFLPTSYVATLIPTKAYNCAVWGLHLFKYTEGAGNVYEYNIIDKSVNRIAVYTGDFMLATGVAKAYVHCTVPPPSIDVTGRTRAPFPAVGAVEPPIRSNLNQKYRVERKDGRQFYTYDGVIGEVSDTTDFSKEYTPSVENFNYTDKVLHREVSKPVYDEVEDTTAFSVVIKKNGSLKSLRWW